MTQLNSVRTFSILLVDDDEVDIMNVQRLFMKNGVPHRLHIAHDGVEALEWLRNELNPRPNIILLDINMPRMSGLEFLRALREDLGLRDITVYVMSTSSNSTDKRTAFSYNVAGYILKPLSVDEFGNAITRLIRFWDVCEFP